MFDNQLYPQLKGTGMGNDFAASYACLTIGFQEESLLFPVELPKQFNDNDCKLIQNAYQRYMDDGFLIWPSHLDPAIFHSILNNLHPDINYTMDPSRKHEDYCELNMLDIRIILH